MGCFFDELNVLDKNCFPTSCWADSVWKGLFDHQQLNVILHFIKTVMIGFVAFSAVAGEAELLKIGVKKANTRQGMGAGLLEEMVQQLRNNGIHQIFLEVREDNLPAVFFYRNHGFKQAGKRANYYQSPVANALIFRRLLNRDLPLI